MADSTPAPPPLAQAQRTDAGIDYELFLDCVHCGLCTSACPTYVELGTEADSPRGRIYLMRSVTDGRVPLNDEVRHHLDLCLDCRACESACPSGVQYGKLIEPFRIHIAKGQPVAPSLNFLQKFLLFHVTPFADRMRLALWPARIMQKLGLDTVIEGSGLNRLLPSSVRQLQAMLPRLVASPGRLPEILPAEGKRRKRVALFTGCAADAFFPQTNLATARILQKNGCEVWTPRNQVCCGALHYHAAQENPAKDLAQRNCEVFFAKGIETIADQVDAVIVNAAGCGAMLKDYGHLLERSPEREQARKFASRVRDLSEFLVEIGPVMPQHPLKIRAAYQDACHLCHAQQIRKQPRQLLEMIPGLELVPIAEPEICCGAAGSYNLTQPEMSERLGRRKVENIRAAKVDAVLSSNVGCLLQMGRYLRGQKPDVWLGHVADALWASYEGKNPLV
jgi:glycolate oxidase iron-sulfur subunit